MKTYKTIITVFFCCILFFSCSKTEDKNTADQVDPIANGEKIYQVKKCAFCHEDQEMLASGKVRDLARPMGLVEPVHQEEFPAPGRRRD